MMRKILALMLVLVLMASGVTLAACGNGDDETDENGVNGTNGTPEQELSGSATYSGQWSGSSEAMGEVGGTWEFEVDFDSGTVSGWFQGDSAGDISGSVAGGVIEASGSAALGSVSWDGSFNADGSRISGEWKFAGGMGSGSWRGTRGEAEEAAQPGPDGPDETAGEETPGEEGDNGDEGSEVDLATVVSRAEAIDCFHGKAVITEPERGEHMMEFWMKNDRTRIDGSIEAQGQIQEGIIIQDRGTNEMLMYSSDTGQAMKMSLGSSQAETDTPDDPAGEVGSIMEWNPNVVGTEEVNGKTCTVVEYSDATGNKTTMWIWVKHGFPVKSIVETPEGDIVTEFKEIDFDCPPDSKLQLPADAEIIDLGGMGDFDFD